MHSNKLTLSYITLRGGKLKMSIKTEKRRERVIGYIAEGLTQRKICEIEGVHIRSIATDMKVLKERISKEISNKDISSIILLVKAAHDSTLQELWKIYKSAEQESTKLGCMKQINQLISETIGLYQRLGLIEKAPEEIVITSGDEIASKMEEIYAESKQLHEIEEDNSGDAGEEEDSETGNEAAVSE